MSTLTTSGSVDCPKCRLVNPSTSKMCDCGYDFEAKVLRATADGKNTESGLSARRGFLLFRIAMVVLRLFRR